MNESTPANIRYGTSCQSVHLQKNQNRPQSLEADNIMISSCLDTLDAAIQPRGLSIKYVSRGRELYHLNKRDFHITGGRYLLVNEHSPVLEARINTPDTWGMCVDIDLALVTDVLSQVITPDDIDPAGNIPRYFLTDELFVQESCAGAELSRMLEVLMQRISSQANPGQPHELLFDLTSRIVQENLPVIGSYYRLKASRLTTRKELYRRILTGREILDSSTDKAIDIPVVAQQCCLSEFRFYRLFKQCFGISPGQYLQQKRIEQSIQLKKQNRSWSEIALQLNFTDLAAFSNTFKKVKGVSPTQYPGNR
ncbi:MAG TPA: AraC family transcriptional regulator [Sphingobacteriaceae bacterium]